MAVAKLEKISILAHKDLQEVLLTELQKAGCIHITDFQQLPYAQEWGLEGVPGLSADDNILSKLEFTLKFLAPYEAPLEGLDKLIPQKPLVSQSKLREIGEKLPVKELYQECKQLDEEMGELRLRQAYLTAEIGVLTPWIKLSCPLRDISPTKTAQVMMIKLPVENQAEFESAFSEAAEGEGEIAGISREGELAYAVSLFPKTKEQEILSLCSQYNVEQVNLPHLSGTPGEERDRYQQELKAVEKSLQEKDAAAGELSKKRPDLALAYDYFLNIEERKNALKYLGATSRTCYLEGWIRKSKSQQLKGRLEKEHPEMEVTLTPPGEDEDPPVDLINNNAVRPFEAVTNLYGLPGFNALDPTPALAPFFFLFFGLCLGDVGYGLLIVLISWLGLKYMSLKDNSKKMMRMFLYCGISTAVAGVLFGAWFGDFFDVLPFAGPKALKDTLMVFDPIAQPVPFLGFTIGLGFIQVCTGIVLSFYDNWRCGERLEAVWHQGGWLLLLLGVGLWALVKVEIIPLTYNQSIEWLIWGSAGALFLYGGRGKHILLKPFTGLLELYDIISYLADMLSYSRILALALATTIIAMVINQICVLMLGIPYYLGYILVPVLWVAAHIFNFAINGLGAFVHTARLQFVEFFPKFFKGGGRTFTPFQWESKYSIIKSE